MAVTFDYSSYPALEFGAVLGAAGGGGGRIGVKGEGLVPVGGASFPQFVSRIILVIRSKYRRELIDFITNSLIKLLVVFFLGKSTYV